MKRHAACDECRRRKLKCQGELPTCSRCRDERIACRYSLRKTMGRPRKRQRGDNEIAENPNSDTSDKHGATSEVATLMSYENSFKSPIDFTRSNDDKVQAHFQQHGLTTDSELVPPSGSGSWGSATGLPPADFSNMGAVAHDSLSDRDNLSESTQQEASPYTISTSSGTGYTDKDPCTCLSSMYLAASNLETTRNLGFPFALAPLKAALGTAKDILYCTMCLEDLASGAQNVMVLHSLLSSIAIGFDKLLRDIDAEANRAKAAGQTKTLAAGDESPENFHRHTGTPDCPGRFNIELEPDEWAKLVKRGIKKWIYVQDAQSLTLEGLVEGTEARQRTWHYRGRGHPSMHRHENGSIVMPEEKEWTCLRLSRQVRQIISHLPE